MNTPIKITVTGAKSKAQEALDESFKILDRLNHELSLYDESSTLSTINQQAGSGAFVPVSKEVIEVIEDARDLCILTDGVFNPLIGPVTKLWKINQKQGSVPSVASLDAALQLCDVADLEITTNSVRLSKQGAALDLGGIAKGYASHVIADYCRQQKVNSLIDLGGNIYVQGANFLNIGIRNPIDPAGAPIVALSVRNSAVITSGGYERFKVIDGVRYTHFFDPLTGKPVRNDLLSATLITPDGAYADGLATTFMIIGSARAMDFLRQHREFNAVLVRDVNSDIPDSIPEPEVLATEGLKGRVALYQPAKNARAIQFF